MSDDSILNEFTFDNCVENMNLPLRNLQYDYIYNLTSSIINAEGKKNLFNLEEATFASPDNKKLSCFLKT